MLAPAKPGGCQPQQTARYKQCSAPLYSASSLLTGSRESDMLPARTGRRQPQQRPQRQSGPPVAALQRGGPAALGLKVFEPAPAIISHLESSQNHSQSWLGKCSVCCASSFLGGTEWASHHGVKGCCWLLVALLAEQQSACRTHWLTAWATWQVVLQQRSPCSSYIPLSDGISKLKSGGLLPKRQRNRVHWVQ